MAGGAVDETQPMSPGWGPEGGEAYRTDDEDNVPALDPDDEQ